MSERLCEICGWPLAESRDKGCVPGDCSYRPEENSPEWHRIRQRRAESRGRSEILRKLREFLRGRSVEPNYTPDACPIEADPSMNASGLTLGDLKELLGLLEVQVVR